MEKEGRNFTMEEIAEHTGYPLKGTVKAKVSRNEWKNVLVRLGPNEFKAQPISNLSKAEFAQRLSVKDMHEPDVPTRSGKLVEKSVHAALSAIEVYNKPDFKYREESFCILMVNAWELLVKAKILRDNAEKEDSIHKKDHEGRVVVSKWTGNPRTISIGEGLNSLSLDQVLLDHLFALVEFRDNAVHMLNDSPMLKLKVQEVGTASLRNYLELAKDWFNVDLARYNFYLMPMSFFHPHELQSYSINSEPLQHQNLLRYIEGLETQIDGQSDSRFSISLELRTEFVKSKLRYSPDDPNAIPVKIESEEAFRRKYPWRYKEDLLPAMNKAFSDFKVGPKFYALKKQLELDARYSGERHLDWNNPKGQKKRFYSPEIMKEFEKHYGRRK
ncbi:MAG TPA: DUF3644 domain-containing protein [Flavobacteriales bacterium]|nr:DUF3644 domain-containing protein [Flavobacteriales bacterium]HMR26896.1 DUF3644 domain-containing protein [Flavobacteriales bacterium]